jgi:hypothetical protein
VRISSPIVEEGINPSTSVWPETRLCQRPIAKRSFGSAASSGAAGGREHRAAGQVEVAREHVHEIDGPARERAELLHARTEPAITRCRLGGRVLAREAPDRRGGDAAEVGDRLGRELARDRAHGVEVVHAAVGAAQAHEILVEERVHEREQERRVAAGPDEVVLARELGGLGPARIDDDQLAAALRDALQAARCVGHRHQAAMRDRGIRADHEQVHRAVDVGHRHREREVAAEHQPGRDDLGQRVDRGRVEQAPARECALQRGAVHERAEVVDDRDCRCRCRSRRCRTSRGSRAGACRLRRRPRPS